jgi:putative ABC transport system permease protein
VNLPIYNVRTIEAFYRMRAVSIFNVLVTIVGAMGLMGLGLSIVGLYGLVAYAASRRTREIGIRMAIGAGRAAVLRMVLRQGIVLALVGLVVGLVASVGVGERNESHLSPHLRRLDPGPLATIIPASCNGPSPCAHRSGRGHADSLR